MSTRSLRSRARFSVLCELGLAFVVGVGLMQFLYSATPDAKKKLPANVPGNDSFYHVKMALLLPEIGLPDRFPWLQHTIFAEQFVSHHYGFHVYLAPFVRMFENPLIGARWAMSVSFGLVLACAMGILILQHVPWRWAFFALLMLLPADFYSRHSYIRAIDLSLFCMLLGTCCLLRRRYVWFAIVLALYTQLYLGSFFLVAIAGIYGVGLLLGDSDAGDASAGATRDDGRPSLGATDMRLRWQSLVPLVIATGLGYAIGLLAHPYNIHIFKFLQTQVFGSGLTPQIRVGREWNPYDNVWTFVNQIGIPLWVMGLAMLARLRRGPRLTTNEWTLLVSSLMFLALMCKARRFVEYAPLWMLLAGGALAAPLLNDWFRRGSDATRRRAVSQGDIWALVIKLGCAVWVLVLAWGTADWETPFKGWVIGIASVAIAHVILVAWIPHLGRRTSTHTPRSWGGSAITAVGDLCVAAAVVGVLVKIAYPIHEKVRDWDRGKFNLNQIRQVAAALQERSQPGDIVFADDWDIFPVFFYYDDKNYYVAGLDPMFSYRHDPELWERYKLLTRGRAPLTTSVKIPETDADGNTHLVDRRITVPLTDIRDRFGARFIVADTDHRPFRRKLDRAKTFVKRIFPDHGPNAMNAAPYVVYEVLPASASENGTKAPTSQP